MASVIGILLRTNINLVHPHADNIDPDQVATEEASSSRLTVFNAFCEFMVATGHQSEVNTSAA